MEVEREKFRSYMEKSGVVASLTNALVALYEEPEKPKDAIEFIQKFLNLNSSNKEEGKNLVEKCQQLESENQRLKNILREIAKENPDLVKAHSTEEFNYLS